MGSKDVVLQLPEVLETLNTTGDIESVKWCLRIADVIIALSCDLPDIAIRREPAYSDFFCTDDPDVAISTFYNGASHMCLPVESKIFDSEMVWSLYRVEGRNVFVLQSPVFGPQPYRIAVFDTEFRYGEVYCAPPETTGNLLPDPLEFPLSEVLMICLLSQRRGLMVHACGIDDNGRGYLFAGNSTHGKTTMARQWLDKGAILNDDRVVLRQREGRFWMYGTPFHGEYSGVSPRGVPLEKIFFLRHAQTNNLRRVKGATAASMLLARSFPPLWDAPGMGFTLEFCGQLTGSVPCYELDFVPDENILDFVRCAP